MKEKILNEIMVILKELEVDQNISLDTKLSEHWGLDSIALIEMIVQLESKFPLNFSQIDLSQINTIDDLCNMIISNMEGVS